MASPVRASGSRDDRDAKTALDAFADTVLPWRAMFEQSPIAQALFVLGRTGVIANAAFARLLGITSDDLLTVAPESLVHADDRPEMFRDLALLEAGELPQVFSERRFLCSDGTIFDGRVATSLIRDGFRQWLFVTVEDVTIELQAARGLAGAVRRARALIDNSPDILAVLHPSGEWEANVRATQLVGYPEGFHPPGGLLSLVHPDDVEGAMSALADILRGARSPHAPIEVRVRAADDSFHHFECVGQRFSTDGHESGLVVTARDVTERKRAEARLQAAEQRFRVVFEHSPLIISIVDLLGDIVDINPAGCAMLGRTRAELLGTPAEVTIHPDDRLWAIERTSAQIDGRRSPVEFRLCNDAGDVIPVLSQASLIDATAAGEAPYVITFQLDISERKRLEAELEVRAAHDGLTGLHNRTSFAELLAHALRQRTTSSLALMFIDLDNFKDINDGFGHDAGDAALMHVAQRIRENMRIGDLAARFGGDEFVFACSVANTAQARLIAERLRIAIQEGFQYAAHPLAITASIGIALAQPGDDPSALLRRADTAAYVAKHTGKARTEVIAVD